MRRAAVAVAVLAVAGCGGTSGDDADLSAAVSPLGLSMAEGAVYAAVDAGDVRLAYRRSRALVFAVESRVDGGDLDAGEGRRLLQRVGDDVRLDCGECSAVLDRAAEGLDGD